MHFFPKADAGLLTSSPDAHSPPVRPTTVGPVYDADNLGRPAEPWTPELETYCYPPKLAPYAPSSIPKQTVALSCRYLRAHLAKNERLRLSMLWYYGRDLENEPEFLAGLQEKACLAQESSGWEFAVIGLLDVNVYIRLATVGLKLGILPRGETICAHTVTQPPGSVFLIPNLQEDWRFQDCPYVEQGGLRAYAGIPLRMQHESGECIGLGTICVASATSQPPLSQQQQQTLTRLADWVVSDIVQCTRARRQRERRRLAELIESVGDSHDDRDSHESVLNILRLAYPSEVIRIQPSDADRCDVNEAETVLPPGLKNGLWEDTAYIDEFIATSNQNATPTDKIVRLLSSHCDSQLGHSLLVVGTKDFRRIFDDVDAWFIQTCANLITQIWQKRLLTEAIKAKEKFLRGMSHQLRTPLHGILGAAELLAEDLKALSLSEASSPKAVSAGVAGSPEIAAKTLLYLDTISGAGRELMSTVNSMITLNRWADIAHAERRYATYDIGDLEEELLKQVSEASLSQSGLTASVFCHCEMPSDAKLRTDMNLLRDSLWPLVHNAMQNTPKGIVAVRFSMRTDTETFMVDVEDTGCGILPHDQERIFQLYEKVNEHSTGSGLGLTISTKFAALLHGSVELVSSQVNHGSHFRATFDDIVYTDSIELPPTATPSFQHLLPEYYHFESDLSSHRLSLNFAKFLTRNGFTRSDKSTGDRLGIFEYSCDPEQLRIKAASMLPDQVAICLVPKSFDTESLEMLPRVLYASAPFSTSKLFSLLREADEMVAVLHDLSSGKEPAYFDRSRSSTNTDEGYNSMDASSPQPLNEESSGIAEYDNESSSTSCASPVRESADRALVGLPVSLPTKSATPMVLVVDDNMVNLRILQMYCKKRGLPFLSAANGTQAVEVFSKHQASSAEDGGARIELVLMDLQMPVCDGLDATEQIRALEQKNSWAASVVFMVTGQDSESDRQAASAAGADDYMVKPIGMVRLDTELKRYFPLFTGQPVK
ncbi:CheY-like superfamily [Beauveria brongniartii RCEF 3172]|uniref:histidine kinase n=1 Tax=Beauveria brongniartii RCEF 3172 TaxID=1081107 RepID=A0A166X6Q4_9HYPO|nr:CheY-like superfamily [Beauveria brongniartii RCEF 3172]